MVTYTYEQQVTFYYSKLKATTNPKYAWKMYYSLKRVPKYHQLSAEQLAKHEAWLEGVAEKISTTFGSTAKSKPAKVSKPKAKQPKVVAKELVEPTKGRNGRTNNSLRIEAAIANLSNGIDAINAGIEILKQVK